MNAWNMFVDTGIVPTEYLRSEDDYTSWVRCSHQSIYRLDLSDDTFFCDPEMDNCLISNSHRVMSYMDSILAKILGSNYAVLLTDAHGKALVDVAYKNNEVIPWEKDNSVENHTVLKALDIACNEKQVIEVYGYEHLYQRGNNWHTIGHPIFNYNKSVAGGFGVICQTDMIPTIVPIVKIGAQLIQATIVLEQIARNNIEILIEGNQNAAIVINEYGIILNANQLFSDLLNIPVNRIIGQEFKDFVTGHIDNHLLYSIYDGFNQIKRVAVHSQTSQEKSVLMKKSIIGNYGSHPLILLAFGMPIDASKLDLSSVSNDPYKNFDDLIGTSPAITGVKRIAQKAAGSLSNVLIEGESGTGKELIAQSIHRASRPQGPFIAINCGAITKELLQSELFGYEEGAFTGAKKGGQPGKFELADGGTVFLDEIGEMPLDMQVSLLRCLQEKTVTRVGGARVRKVNVRIIAATNRCLLEEVQKGHFREDLYYRLNVIKIKMPSLRDRIQDIPILSQYLLTALREELNICEHVRISDEAMDCLCRHDWPGNVRELRNCLESALVYMDNNILGPDCLPQQMAENLPQACADSNGSLKEYERIAIMEAIIKNQGNISKSAKDLGIARSTLYLKMEKLCITY